MPKPNADNCLSLTLPISSQVPIRYDDEARREPANDAPSRLSVALREMAQSIENQSRVINRFRDDNAKLETAIGNLRQSTNSYAKALKKIDCAPLHSKSKRLADLMDRAVADGQALKSRPQSR